MQERGPTALDRPALRSSSRAIVVAASKSPPPAVVIPPSPRARRSAALPASLETIRLSQYPRVMMPVSRCSSLGTKCAKPVGAPSGHATTLASSSYSGSIEPTRALPAS